MEQTNSTNNNNVKELNKEAFKTQNSIKKSSSTKSSVSISNLMERFTSRRQHSDSNLHRMLAHAWNHTPAHSQNLSMSSTISKKSTNGSLDESIEGSSTNLNRRSFKWKSLFSTPKVNSLITTNGTKITSLENLNLEKINRRFSPGSSNNLKKMPFNKTLGQAPSLEHHLAPLFEDSSVSILSTEPQKQKLEARRNSATVIFRYADSIQNSEHCSNRHSFQTTSIKNSNTLRKRILTHNGKEIFEVDLQKNCDLQSSSLQLNSRPFSVIGSGDFENLIEDSGLSEYRVTENNNKKLLEFVQMHEKIKAKQNAKEESLFEDNEKYLNESTTSYKNLLNRQESCSDFFEKDSAEIQNKSGIVLNEKSPEASSFANQQCVNREKAKRYNYYNNCNSLKIKRSVVSTSTTLGAPINRRATTTITAANLPSMRPFSPASLTESSILTPTLSLAGVGRVRKKRLGSSTLRRQSIHANMILNANELEDAEQMLESRNLPNSSTIQHEKKKKTPPGKSVVVLRTKKKSKITLSTSEQNESNKDVLERLLF